MGMTEPNEGLKSNVKYCMPTAVGCIVPGTTELTYNWITYNQNSSVKGNIVN